MPRAGAPPEQDCSGEARGHGQRRAPLAGGDGLVSAGPAQPRSRMVVRRERITWPSRNRLRSSARSRADAKRRAALSQACQTDRLHIAREPGTNRTGATGSSTRTCSMVSATLAALNGGRPVSSSYRIAPSE